MVIVLQRAREDRIDEFASWQGRIGMAVLVALYPLTLIISLWGTGPFGFPLVTGMLIGDTVLVVLLSYLVMPLTNRVFGFWMKPDCEVTSLVSIRGVLAIPAFTVLVWFVFGYFFTVPHVATVAPIPLS